MPKLNPTQHQIFLLFKETGRVTKNQMRAFSRFYMMPLKGLINRRYVREVSDVEFILTAEGKAALKELEAPSEPVKFVPLAETKVRSKQWTYKINRKE